MNGLARAAGFRDHIHGIASHDKGVGMSKHSKIWIVAAAVRDEGGAAGKCLPQSLDISRAGTPRSRDEKSIPLDRNRFKLGSKVLNLHAPEPVARIVAAEQNRDPRLRNAA